MKRILSMLLMVLMLLTMVTGCKQTNEPAEPTVKEPETTDQSTIAAVDAVNSTVWTEVNEGDSAENITVFNTDYFPLAEIAAISRWKSYENSYTNNDISQVSFFDWLEEKTNVHVEWETVSSSDAATKFNLMLVSGEPCDIMDGFTGYYTSTPTYAVEEELIIDLGEQLPEYMPNYWNLLRSNAQAMREVTTDDGTIPIIYTLGSDWGIVAAEPIWMGLVYREDWANEQGFGELTTIEQWHDYLLACTTNYDSCDSALSLGTAIWDMSANFLTAYGSYPGFYVRDGKVQYGPLDEGYREAVQNMVNWYAEGLLDKDFGGGGWGGNTDKLASGQTVACNMLWNPSGTYLLDIGEVDIPDWNLKAAAPPVLQEGDPSRTAYTGRRIAKIDMAISATAEDTELVARWMDQLFCFESMVKNFMGTENETYTITDGIYDYVEGVGTEQSSPIQMARFSLGNDTTGLYDFRHFDWLYSGNNHDAVWTWDEASTDEVMPAGVILNAEESEEYSAIYNDVQTYVEENLGQFVMGAKSMDDYDDFVQTLRSKFDIERCIELQQTAYDRYMSR